MSLLEDCIKTKQKVIHTHALDILKHVLRGDTKATMFKYPPEKEEQKRLEAFTKRMEQRADQDDFEQVIDDCYKPSKKWRVRYQESDGDFSVDRYLENDERMFEAEYKDLAPADGLTLILPLGIPYADREKSYMIDRHKQCYTMVMEALSIGRPVRVIAIDAFKMIEGTHTLFLTIKDWNDPIFPGIWGALKDNKSTNDFTNILADYFFGTAADGNGSPGYIKVNEYFNEGEYVIVGTSKYLN